MEERSYDSEGQLKGLARRTLNTYDGADLNDQIFNTTVTISLNGVPKSEKEVTEVDFTFNWFWEEIDRSEDPNEYLADLNATFFRLPISNELDNMFGYNPQ